MLFLGIGVLLPVVFRGEMQYATIAFLIGLPYGLLIDFVGVKLGLWKYGGSKWVYFMITVPCWGAFSMAINLIWNWIKNPWLAFPIITVGLFSYLELPNLKTKSWTYSVPLWFVAIGWIPLVLSFRVVYISFLYFIG
jgi:hypothetical protein